MIIYRITNTVNGKVYIGQTVHTLDYRWKGHVWCANRGDSWALSCAIRKYGAGAFEKTVIGVARTKQDLDALERAFIAKYRSNKTGFGYNQTLGGGGSSGVTRSAEWRRKQSIARKGKKRLPESVEKSAAAIRGRTYSPAHRAAISKGIMGIKFSGAHRLKLSLRKLEYYAQRNSPT